ncbi:MAG TPA: hypothetical protein VGE38_16805 [Nocardioides sp.]|uniref:hypothetical protein n=1 Tax=Nocardioides sp. TaxID=35761 RepID=UPI002EDB3EBD
MEALPPEERHGKLLGLLRDALGDEDQWLVAAVDRTAWELVTEMQERWGRPLAAELLASLPTHLVTFLEGYGLQTERLEVA